MTDSQAHKDWTFLQIERLAGKGHVREPQGLETSACEIVVEPENADQVAELVRKCESDRITLAPVGSARTLSQIRAKPVVLGVSLSRMNRVIAYEPDDMTIIVEAGVTLGEVNRLTARHNQRLPIDPRDPDRTTIGAMIGAAQVGPWRLSEGTVRDLMIGVGFVGHGGRLAHGGGRVVKNVAGYDLMKVMTGSFGTLAVVVEAAFKVRPVPANYTLAQRKYGRHAEALDAAAALNHRLPLIHLEILNPGMSDSMGYEPDWIVIAGFAGNQGEIDYQRASMLEILGDETEILEGADAESAYVSVRDMTYPEHALAARASVPPGELARYLRECPAEYWAHAGSGVAQIWLEDPHEEVAADTAAQWRDLARSMGGNLRVIHAPEQVRTNIEFFDRPRAGAFRLMERLKKTFDPSGIFNPGCFVGGL